MEMTDPDGPATPAGTTDSTDEAVEAAVRAFDRDERLATAAEYARRLTVYCGVLWMGLMAVRAAHQRLTRA